VPDARDRGKARVCDATRLSVASMQTPRGRDGHPCPRAFAALARWMHGCGEMTRAAQGTPRRWLVAFPLVLLACACTDAAPKAERASSVEGSLGRTTEQDGTCDVSNAGSGWVNTFMPQSFGEFTIGFSAYPASSATPSLVDSVVGLSDGPAASFRDLGPIVRFNEFGYIDARDGDAYTGAFPYRTGDGPFEFMIDVSIPAHRYTVWVRHRDALAKPFELLGENLAFRSEQSGATRLDTIARYTDSVVGSLETCGFEYHSADACRTSTIGSWASQDFIARSEPIRVEFAVTTDSPSIDGVIGLSNGVPASFANLAAIVRFRPDGTLDARNGSQYAADAVVPYGQDQRYEFALDVDVPNGTYTAMVHDTSDYGLPSVVFARDYAFRSEQSDVTSLDHVGQFVDDTPGLLAVCDLTLAY
jgi:hypothetical protein